MFKPTPRDIVIIIGILIIVMAGYWTYRKTTGLSPVTKDYFYEQGYYQGQQDFVGFMVNKVEDKIKLSNGQIIMFKVIQ